MYTQVLILFFLASDIMEAKEAVSISMSWMLSNYYSYRGGSLDV